MGLFSGKKIRDKNKDKTDKKAVKIKAGKTKEDKILKELRTEDKKKGQNKKSMKDLYNNSKPTAWPAKENKEVKAKNQFSNAYRILIKPMVTEKASIIASANKYVFQVSSDANKIEIAKAINNVYGIKPVSVNIVTMEGKKTRYGRITGKRKNWKKAIITLPAGSSIKLYEGV